MPSRAVLFVVLIVAFCIEPAARAWVETPRAQIAAHEVAQPDGWDDALALPEPEDLNPDPDVIEIRLEAKVVDIELTPGIATTVWTYNGMLPGPYIRAKVGDTLIVHFTNSLPEPTTIHWHGLRVPNAMDGAPGMTQAPIAPGGEFRYEFVVRDAGTYWYHPHHSSSDQVGRGLYGPIVIEDPRDPAAFGDNLVLMLSDMTVGEDRQIVAKDNGGAFADLFGREGNVMLVNGRIRPRLKVRAGKPQRWRIINATRARYYSLLPPGGTFVRVGGDNGLAARSERVTSAQVVPGERFDVVFTPSSKPGSATTLRWRPVDRGAGTVFGRRAEPIMEVETITEPPVASAAIPESLRDVPPIDLANVVEYAIDLTIKREGNTVEMGINGVPSWRAAPLRARLGETHVWTITNNSAFDHPFHLHGYFFRVLDEGRVPEWKDTVNVPVDSSIRIAVVFDERPGVWMYHCHILDHAEVGMMGHLHVE